MTRIVLVDGENLMYGLRNVMGDKKTTPRDIFGSYDFRGLIEEILVDDVPTEVQNADIKNGS